MSVKWLTSYWNWENREKMSLTSFWFFVFLIITLFVYYLFPKFQKYTILIASLIFYKLISPQNIGIGVLLLVIFCATYFGAILTEHFKSFLQKKITFIFSIGIIIFILCYYKYLHNFLSVVTEMFNINADVSFIKLVPYIGVSYFSLSAIGYLVDIYWNSYKAEKHPVIIANFLYYFPQVISGPVTRFNEMRKEFAETHALEFENIYYGLRRMMWGYFKKLVISERFACVVNGVYGHYTDFGMIDIILATFGMYGYNNRSIKIIRH